MRVQLLCTFTHRKQLHNTIQKIVENFNIVYNKIFILNTDNPNEVVCSYNVEMDDNVSFLPNTILVHRKKETNTLYTINALNTLIETINNGILDANYPVSWENYTNMLLVTNEDGLKKISTTIFDITHIKPR